MAGLPKNLMRRVGKGEITMKQAWAIHKGKGGSKKRSSPKKRSSSKAASSSSSGSSKKMTMGKIQDLYSLGGAGIWDAVHLMEHKDPNRFMGIVTKSYTGLDPVTGQFDAKMMLRGYGGAVNRVIEKKTYKALHIKGPRSQISTVGDVLDYLSYYGKSAADLYAHKDNKSEAAALVLRNLNGMDYRLDDPVAGYALKDKVYNSMGPYIAQKMIRKGLRRAGINFGGIF